MPLQSGRLMLVAALAAAVPGAGASAAREECRSGVDGPAEPVAASGLLQLGTLRGHTVVEAVDLQEDVGTSRTPPLAPPQQQDPQPAPCNASKPSERRVIDARPPPYADQPGLHKKPPNRNVRGWNPYGWYLSSPICPNGCTEVVAMAGHRGKLFASVGYWMHPWGGSGAIMRLDKSDGLWLTDHASNIVMRFETLKVLRWKNAGENLYTTAYSKAITQGSVAIWWRDDNKTSWEMRTVWVKYWAEHYYSARVVAAHTDSVTGAELVFISVGVPGILAVEVKDLKLGVLPWRTETGKIYGRPLGLTELDGRLHYSSLFEIFRRSDGPSPRWTKVFEMPRNTECGNLVCGLDVSVGGIRGLSSISHGTGRSLIFAFCGRTDTACCINRLDPQGDGYARTEETCVKHEMLRYARRNLRDFRPVEWWNARVDFTLAAYNDVLELPKRGGGHYALIGFEALLWGSSRYMAKWPTSPQRRGNRAYYAGAGYLVRKGPGDYETREVGGPRWGAKDASPPMVATRCYTPSPFPGEHESVFFGGYDANYFPAHNTAWIMQGVPEAVYAAPVPCFRELGCWRSPDHWPPSWYMTATAPPTTTTTTTTRPCDLCPGQYTNYTARPFGPSHKYTCKDVIDHVNKPGATLGCGKAQADFWTRCCIDLLPPDPHYNNSSIKCTGEQLKLKVGAHDATTFRCNGGLCVSMKGRCNGVRNCDDGSDEFRC